MAYNRGAALGAGLKGVWLEEGKRRLVYQHPSRFVGVDCGRTCAQLSGAGYHAAFCRQKSVFMARQFYALLVALCYNSPVI